MLSHELDSGGSISLYAIINRVEVAGKGYNPAAICLVFVMLIRMCKDKVLSRIQFAGLDYSCYVTLLFERISHLSPDFRCRRSVQLANVCSLSLALFRSYRQSLRGYFRLRRGTHRIRHTERGVATGSRHPLLGKAEFRVSAFHSAVLCRFVENYTGPCSC